LQQSAFFVLFFVKFYFIKGAKRGVSRVSILRDDLTISFYDKNFLQNLYKIIFFFCFDFIFGTFLLVYYQNISPFEHVWAYFHYYYWRYWKKREEKNGLKQRKLTETYDNADEFEILFNYSIYLQKSIVFKKFT